MNILVFVEHRGMSLDRASLGVLTKAASLGAGSVGAVICGGGNGTGGSALETLAAEAARYGASTVHVARHEALDPPLPQPRVDVIADVVRTSGYDAVFFSNSVLASDVAGGLAARLRAGLNWDLSDVEWRAGELVGRRTALQDSLLIDVGWRSLPGVALFRTGAFEAAATRESGDASIDEVAVVLSAHSSAVRIVSMDPLPESDGVSIDSADVVVAGGMGLGGPEHMALAENLAQALGGAVGATRAVVYAGWYPRTAQIGQTGKTVSPRLYVALGISGAVQHKVGMQSSKVIVAINKDPNAPVFDCADLGVVGDVHAIVPKLIDLVRARKNA